MKSSEKGSLLLDGILTLFAFLLVHMLLFEVLRRGIFSLMMNHMVCKEVREHVLGENRNTIALSSVQFLENALGKQLTQEIARKAPARFYHLFDLESLRRFQLGSMGGGVVERFLRYPQFLRFKQQNSSQKHHQEIIARCLFPLSSS